jgi:hypothetical protein
MISDGDGDSDGNSHSDGDNTGVVYGDCGGNN